MPKLSHSVKIYPALTISLIYLLMGSVWILFTDDFVERLPYQVYPQWQTFKGIFYVLLTGLSLYFLLTYFDRRQRQQLQYFEVLFTQNPSPIWICSETDGQILHCNQMACQAYGYKQQELYQQKICHLLPELDWQNLLKIYPGPQETQVKNAQGQLVHASIFCQKVPSGLLIMAHNIEELKTSQVQLHKLNTVLVQQNNRLHEFARIVAHHLRSPVANLLGLLHLHNPQEPDPEFTPVLYEKLQLCAQKLDGTLHDLNHILSEQKVLDEPLSQVNLHDAIQEVLHLPSLQQVQANIDLNQNFAPDTTLYTHRRFFLNILTHLLRNCLIYHSPERPLQIWIRLQQKQHQTVLEIEDNGLGMDLKVVSDKLFRFQQRFHSDRAGRGIGLYLVKTQVELLGGSISVRSEPNQGSCFCLEFPLHLPSSKNDSLGLASKSEL